MLFLGQLYLYFFQKHFKSSIIPFPSFNQTNEFQGEAAQRSNLREQQRKASQNSFGSLKLGNGIKGCLHFIILISLSTFTAHIIDYGSLIMGIIVVGYMVKMKSINMNIAAFVVAFTSLLHTTIHFPKFGMLESCLSLIVAITVWLSIAHDHFEKKSPIDVRIISRHSMLIYFAHILIIQFAWRYYVY